MPGLDPGIHAEVVLTQCYPPVLCLLVSGMDRDTKCGGDEI
jgi:hypothetical protein